LDKRAWTGLKSPWDVVVATSPRYYFYFKEKPGKKKVLLGLAESDVKNMVIFQGRRKGLKIRRGGGL
jgi:hypothetical protein